MYVCMYVLSFISAEDTSSSKEGWGISVSARNGMYYIAYLYVCMYVRSVLHGKGKGLAFLGEGERSACEVGDG